MSKRGMVTTVAHVRALGKEPRPMIAFLAIVATPLAAAIWDALQ